MNDKKVLSTGILFINDKEEVLLFLRDDIPTIPYPGCWDILGGYVDRDETPENCIVREMKEEIGIDIGEPVLFKIYDIKNIIENMFWKKINWDIDKIDLQEGQKLEWFTEDEIKKIPEEKMHFGFKSVVLDFFKERPFDK
jgi:8-oxo-dGTP diphosphatase